MKAQKWTFYNKKAKNMTRAARAFKKISAGNLSGKQTPDKILKKPVPSEDKTRDDTCQVVR